MDTALSQYIQKVFSSWTVLRIAEQQSSGGMNTPGKIRDLAPYITQRLSRQTQPCDIAEWLDGQLDVADLIFEAHSLQLAGKINEITELTARVPAGCDLSSCTSQVTCDKAELPDVSEGDDDDSSDLSGSECDDREMDVN
ncbi:hypothetical protein TcWFU_007166 [Taenia crassiceps]|uniref:Pre-rRNA-processing protein TSR2 homolog n=1 Tax=Taenia crassiceps TaxID=6207 RepID=A0ABR4QLV5_9CEST